MHGTLVFAGTRVPVESLIQHLVAGDSLDIFLDDFPTVSREQAMAYLQQCKKDLYETQNTRLNQDSQNYRIYRRLKFG